MNTTLTLVRRELLEHRSIFFAPSILTVIILAGTVFGVIKGVGASNEVAGMLGDLNEADPARVKNMLQSLWSIGLVSLAVPFNLLMSVVAGFYLLDSLYGERKDRSVLFWRSLPVSDTQAVLAKLLTGLIAVGVVGVLAVLVAYLSTGLVLSVGLIALGQNPFTLLLLPAPWISGPLFLVYVVVSQALWFAPFAAWLLLVSSAARSAPILWAVGVPAALSYAEWLMFRSRNLIDLIAGHVHDYPFYALSDEDDLNFDSDDFGDVFDEFGDLEAPLSLLSVPDPVSFVSAPALWIGLVVAVALAAGAIRLRRYHDV